MHTLSYMHRPVQPQKLKLMGKDRQFTLYSNTLPHARPLKYLALMHQSVQSKSLKLMGERWLIHFIFQHTYQYTQTNNCKQFLSFYMKPQCVDENKL